jgi:molybdate transport system regulatory protein
MTETISTAQQHYQMHGHFWIESSHGTFLGRGRVVLLERIRDLGSISAAARSMKMSYRQAWQLVNTMNTYSANPLVISATGGSGGGGASLTSTGEHAIQLFWQLQREFDDYLNQRSQNLNL